MFTPDFGILYVVFYDLDLEDSFNLLTKLVLIKDWYEVLDYAQWSEISLPVITAIWLSLGHMESWVWAFWWYIKSHFGEDAPDWSLAASPERHCAICVMLQYLSLSVLKSKCYSKIRVSKLDLPYLFPCSSSGNAMWLSSTDHNQSAKGSVESLTLKTLFYQFTVSWLINRLKDMQLLLCLCLFKKVQINAFIGCSYIT